MLCMAQARTHASVSKNPFSIMLWVVLIAVERASVGMSLNELMKDNEAHQ